MLQDRIVRIVLALFLFNLMNSAAAEVQFTVDGFIIEGNNPISESETNAVLKPYTGVHNGIEKLRQAATALEAEINQKGYDFHRVTLPPQVLESGVVTLEIRHLIVGEISTSGNKHFSDSNLVRSLPQLKQGKTPNTHALSRALAVANFNTAKRTRLTFGRGDQEDTLDARIEVRDRTPQQVYAWLNNTGTEESTRSRIGVGYQHRNLFDRDHNLTATYTTSPEEPDKVEQYGLNYQIPVYPLTATVGLFYVDSNVDSGRVADAFDVAGTGETAGIRYSQVLNKIGTLRQRAYIDVIDKLFDNEVEFFGSEIGIDVRSRPLTAAWQLEWEIPDSSGHLNLSFSSNLNGGSFNNETAYALSRIGAPQDWQAIRLNAAQDVYLPKQWQLSFGLQGQYTEDPLISGEQLGLGGTYGPRGFEEREIGVDRGWNLKVQLWTPPTRDGLQFGSFIDYGTGTLLNPQPGEVDSRDLTSIGLSAKWQWQNRLVAAIDVGHVVEGLDEPTLTQDGDNQVHVSLVYRISKD
ncbi:MAG: ShlB/FhaC/HecB family hemolysin secretion/activation protein [bacterium]